MNIKTGKLLDLHKIEIFGGTKNMDLYSFMRDRANIHNYVVMKKDGTIIGEDYWNGTDKTTKNHLMSASKSFTAVVASIAAEKGYFSFNDPIEKWIPEFKGSPLEGATVQMFADMRSGIRTIDSEYDDAHNYHWAMGEWSTWDWAMPVAAGYNGFDTDENGKKINRMTAHGRLDGIVDFLKVLARNVKLGNKPGEGYNYKCVNTEILGLVAERAIAKATGQSFIEFMGVELWQKAGFQEPVAAFMDLNHERMPYSGGLNMTTRDFAIAAQLMAHEGKNYKGQQVVPKWFVDAVRDGNSEVKHAWKFPDNQEQVADADGFYCNQFRTVHINGRKISAMVGVNGQFSVVDWKTGNTLSIFASFGKPSGPTMIATFFNVIDALFTAAENQENNR
jgi:CubicO group peptidase (beta-lactamase class C family)